ncbi:MAG TPA: hypothetical protein EYQ25_04855 [Planctomycetes bacterium]|nr:hypothetical protein [Planctomycetota bacterium]
MKTHNNTRNACILAVVLAMGTGAASAQTTIAGTAGGNDSWNDPTNWDAGVPSGAIDAIVSGGVWAQVNNASTLTYSGSLTLNANSTLTMAGATGSESAVWGVSGITMNAGSEIQVNVSIGVDFPAITLLGDAKLSSLFGASDWETDNCSAITGAHTLTLEHFNGHTINLNAANGFSELIIDTLDRWNLHATVAGSLGTGNVTINPRPDGRSASLYFDANDAMADTATLTLNGSPGQGGFSGNGSDYVILNADDTIAALYVYGVQQPAGAYTNSEAWISGNGTLTVASSAGPIGTNYCGPAIMNSANQSAVISAIGVDQAGGHSLELTAARLPVNQFGYFLVSMTQGYGANFGGSQGSLCLRGQIGGFYQGVRNSRAAGTFTLDVDTLVIPQPGGPVGIQPGETWNFQAWFRDRNPNQTTNFTNGISILFQ